MPHTVRLKRRTVCQELRQGNVGLRPRSQGGLATAQQENQTMEYMESLKYQSANAFSPQIEVAKPYQLVSLSTTTQEISVSRKQSTERNKTTLNPLGMSPLGTQGKQTGDSQHPEKAPETGYESPPCGHHSQSHFPEKGLSNHMEETVIFHFSIIH